MDPEQLLAQVKRAASSLSPRQQITLAGVFVAVVALVIGSTYWMNVPSYTLLYSDLDAESAAAVTDRLKAADVPYVLDAGGTAIRVPVERVDELRLQMASQGLPATGRIGFELFDRTAFGTTEFLEQVNFRRGLEGELARTIGTITEVASARVHIALAKDSLFTERAQPAKASVVLRLKNRKPLAPSTITAIAGLVAGSVESLRAEDVVILDTFGRPLSSSANPNDVDGATLDQQQRLERDLSARVIALLESVVGAGRVRANVAVRLNTTTEEQTEERWDPTTVVRSRQSTTDSGSGVSTVGVAGARANAVTPVNQTPRVATLMPSPAASRSSETVNYEVNKLTRHMIAPRGQVARVTVAVIVDEERITAPGPDGAPQTTTKTRSPEEVERLHRLVAAAIGLDDTRGDQVTVESMAFDEVPTDAVDTGGWLSQVPRPVMDGAPYMIRMVAVIALAAMAFLMVLRPLVRSAFPPPAAVDRRLAAVAVEQPVRTVADLENAFDAELDAESAPRSPEAQRIPALTKRLAKKTDEDPELMARLVRSLLVEEER